MTDNNFPVDLPGAKARILMWAVATLSIIVLMSGCSSTVAPERAAVPLEEADYNCYVTFFSYDVPLSLREMRDFEKDRDKWFPGSEGFSERSPSCVEWYEREGEDAYVEYWYTGGYWLDFDIEFYQAFGPDPGGMLEYAKK